MALHFIFIYLISYIYILNIFTNENLTYLEYDDWGSSCKKTNTFVY